MSFFPYPTISSFFEAEGDFPENLEITNEFMSSGYADEDDEVETEPCCYNSSRNFGTGEHEYDCPNYGPPGR